MRIVFFCGSLEPGHDGVGDYTRLLAVELVRLGHQASIVALNDQHITDLCSSTQDFENSNFPILRIPSTWSSKKRFNHARAFVDDFVPHWLSLQFVPFSFHTKGLPVRLGKRLAALGKGRSWHIMFHELWVGRETGDDIKRIVYSVMQKLVIKQLVKRLQPTIIHTSLPNYYIKLNEIGYNAKALPLFSNIIFVKSKILKRQNFLRIGIFSQIEANRSVIDFIIDLIKQAKLEDLQVEIVLIGGKQTNMENFKNILVNLGVFSGQIKLTGFLKAADISIILQSCTLGLTSVPRHGLGKSGSVAAFLAHGIPVAAPTVFPDYDPEEIGFFSIALKSAILLKPDINRLKDTKTAACTIQSNVHISIIAKDFLADLQAYKTIN